MSSPTPKQLIGGYWGVNPSPVVDDYAGVCSAVSGPGSGLYAGSPLACWTIQRTQRVFPGPNGSVAYGYPAPASDPVWISLTQSSGPVLTKGPDFTIEDGYVWFTRDPFFDRPGRMEFSAANGFQPVLDIWYGAEPTSTQETPPLDATAYALAKSIATSTDSPCSGPVRETVTDIWQAADGSWRVVTNVAVYRLESGNDPVVVAGDVLAPGSPIGQAWSLEKLDFRTVSDYITLPASFMQGVTEGNVTWYRENCPILVDDYAGRTRVRFDLGVESIADFDAIWEASMVNGVENGRTLAQALDTRPSGTGDPGAANLPRVVSPMRLLAKELLAGCAYRLIVKPDKFGPSGLSVDQVAAAARTAAGSYPAIFVWENEEPVYDPVQPSTTTTTTHPPTTTTTTYPPTTTTTTYPPTTTTTTIPPTTTTTTVPGGDWYCINVTSFSSPGGPGYNCFNGSAGTGPMCVQQSSVVGGGFPCGPSGTTNCHQGCGGGVSTYYDVTSGPHADYAACSVSCGGVTTTTNTTIAPVPLQYDCSLGSCVGILIGDYPTLAECEAACGGYTPGDCCTLGALYHPDLKLTIADGPNAGDHTVTWAAGCYPDGCWVALTPSLGAEILFGCGKVETGTWRVKITPTVHPAIGWSDSAKAATQTCMPSFLAMWDDADVLAFFSTTQPIRLTVA